MTENRLFKLAYDAPASAWEEALPLGNGRLGAMVFGVPDRETIQLNEDSIWSGLYRDRNNPAARAALPEIRRLLNEGRAREAEELCLENLSGVPAAQRVYQSAGELHIDFSPHGGFGHARSGTRGGPLLSGIRNYRRELDIKRAVHTLSFEYQGTVYTRECFISAPAGILALRFSACAADSGEPAGKIGFRVTVDRGVFYDRKGNTEDAAFIVRDDGIPFCAMVKIINKGGTLRGRGGFISVENADEALLLLDIQSAFREQDYVSACHANLCRAAGRSWEALLAEHITEHRSWFDRLELEIGDTETARYFHFCRYLLIASSRPGTLPANLQGIWNSHLDPPWGSDYTININTQMNYWPACMCNLAETEGPLFDLLECMYPNGKKTAEIMYGCRGFTAHHNTDIWGDTAPRDYWIPTSYWSLGAAWLAIHIWEHFEYTRDTTFLAKYFYLIEEACVFFTDFLTPAKANLIVSPSASPENSYVQSGDVCSLSAGCEMDNQILRALFQAALRAGALLGKTGENADRLRSILERIPAPVIDSNGAIREWHEEFAEAEPGHRHFSHLWALWPGDAITPDETPELAQAARNSIARRLSHNGGHTGWSRAWLVNFFARLGDGEAALEHLRAILGEFTLPNLLNNGPPFQIDGNFGALAGITQMLAQSRIRYNAANSACVTVDLLPALPTEWPQGRVKGLCVKGNIAIDLEWQGGRVTSFVMRNMGEAVPVIIRANETRQERILPPGETVITL